MADITSLTQKLNAFGISEPVKPYPGSNPELNPIDLFRSYITQELSRVSGIEPAKIFPALEWTNTSDRGDLIIPIPRITREKNHEELAAEWTSKFENGPYLSEVIAKGKFIQFFFNPRLLGDISIKDILQKGKDFGKAEIGKGQRIVVEFSSPNIAKPFHAGHLRSTIIGGFISNLHEALGFDVVRLNYLGDWGKQFGVLGVGFRKYGSEEALEKDPIQHLFDVYVKINQDITSEKEAQIAAGSTDPQSEIDNEARAFFKKMADGDEESLNLWKKFRALSIERYKATYERLNIFYDSYSGESQVSEERLKEVTKELQEANLITEDKGALLVDLTKYNKKLGKAIVQKKDGTSLYLTRDLGAAIDRHQKYKFDKMFYIIASQQDLHTAQFFKILELMGYEWAKNLKHINFGMVQGMSTRKGTVVFLDTILEETKNAMHEVMKKNEEKYAQVENPEEIADLVGMSAVLIQDMSAKRINNYAFNWSRMLSFEGDTGPYLQYAHSRLRSVERKAGELNNKQELEAADYSLLTEPCAIELIRLIAQYPDVLLNALRTLEPSTVVTYLFKLTHTVSSCYDVLWVAGQEKPLAQARLALYSSARQVLYNGMKLLNLTPVDRM
ncbi:uncharacterized protein SAPINGB_P000942 [Magnusiomyces paraingens]|uniref:arginine--tRNA ligase n=1 Tax=Magnusiomyces paraingens TaxID=2606893 RepID=A0A5E8B3S4_9ASCO|nr:uncharacterized protein SAPINGB_P000942 [Saprochaete ingens]VVT45890.1 unnamed protein product [Saprochaete ingens]